MGGERGTPRRDEGVALPRSRPTGPVLVLALTLALTAALRWRWLDIPLERDEGEYAYAGQLILEGEPPYRFAYNMKFPGTYVAYAVAMGAFGETPRGVHLGLLAANLAAIALVFALARETLSDRAAVAAAVFYAILSIGPATLGTAAHATQFVVPPALAGTLLLLRGLEGRRGVLVASGACLGLAILAKQPGAAFLAFALLFAAWRHVRSGTFRERGAIDLGAIAVGAALPLLVTALWLAIAGVFGRFWFWTIRYAGAYATERTLPQGWERLREAFGDVLHEHPVLWALAAAGLVLAVTSRSSRERGTFLAGLALFSFLSACPGLFFRPHYFVPLLAVAAILAGAAIARISKAFATRAAFAEPAVFALLVATVTLASVWNQQEFSPKASPLGTTLSRYRGNPFGEAPEIARYLREHTQPGDRIAVVGSEPEIYFYAHRRSATGYLYTYPMMENQAFAATMRAEMVREIEDAKPVYIVVVTNKYSWLKHPDSSTAMFDWIREFVAAHYEASVVLEGAGTPGMRAHWDARSDFHGNIGPESVFVGRWVQ